MKIAQNVMFKRLPSGKTMLEQHRCNEDTVLGSYKKRVVTFHHNRSHYALTVHGRHGYLLQVHMLNPHERHYTQNGNISCALKV